MRQILLVGAGGFMGAVLRYRLGIFVFAQVPSWKFPLHTVLVNISGCLVAGVLAGLIEKHQFGAEARLFLFPGLLGGFTTFSAFGLETINLLQRQEYPMAALNVGISVAVGLLALWLGMRAVS